METTKNNLADAILGIIESTDPTAVVEEDNRDPDHIQLLVRSGNFGDSWDPNPHTFPHRPWQASISIYGRESSGRGSDLQVTVFSLEWGRMDFDMFKPDSAEKLEAAIREVCSPNWPDHHSTA
jgi:hypothetical protein